MLRRLSLQKMPDEDRSKKKINVYAKCKITEMQERSERSSPSSHIHLIYELHYPYKIWISLKRFSASRGVTRISMQRPHIDDVDVRSLLK